MEPEQKFTGEISYSLTDDFIDGFEEIYFRTGLKIVKLLAQAPLQVPTEKLTSHIIGGVVHEEDNTPVTFAIEVINIDDETILFSDIKLISMDEYLDLINLNLFLPQNDQHTESKDAKKHS